MFDRSWYNRAGVERVMGFCTPQEEAMFLRHCPIFEQMLIDDGILLRKYWFSVSEDEQLRRFKSRMNDPLRRWKLSPMDMESIYRWEDYSRAKDDMMVHTDTPASPWFVVESHIKKHARLNMISHLLSSIPYEEVELENVELPMEYGDVPAAEQRVRALELLDLVGLGHRVTHRPAELSGGERQRVAIARALVNRPQVLLADEPTGNLDSRTGGEILDLLGEEHRRGLAIVMVTHDASIADRADRTRWLRDGRVAEGA